MSFPCKLSRYPAQVFLFLTLVTGGIARVVPAQALNFKFNADPNINPQALAGFQAAGNLWSSWLKDDVTVNIDIGFQPLSEGVLAETGSNSRVFSYAEIEQALIGDRKSANDAIALNNLPGVNIDASRKGFAFIASEEDGSLEIDGENGWSVDNQFLDVYQANAKALGLLTDNGSADAEIVFNQNFNFDFDRTNGIDNNSFDFIGVAAHEIGHALGFVSGVDTVDVLFDIDLDNSVVFNVLDLYRYSADSVDVGNASGFPVLDLAADDGDKYFSIDGGTTNLGLWATGTFGGDGDQASHWKSGFNLGLMDPRADYGDLLTVSELDLQAFDVIGWDRQSEPIPEPGTIAGAVLGSLTLGFQFFRKKRK